MKSLLVERNRTVILLLIVIFIFGSYAYIKMPRESNPDIQIPIISVFIGLPGISVEDSEKLLVIPIENELRSIEGVKELQALAINDGAHIILKFGTEYSNKEVLDNVRSKLLNIKSKLPVEAESPVISEINLSLFPILNVGLIGNLPERALTEIAHRLKKEIESLPNVLKVAVAGMRKETAEVIIEPTVLTKYNIQSNEIFYAISNNNRLVEAGSLDNDTGKYSIKVSGLLKDVEDVMNIPIRSQGDAVLRIKDVAKVYPRFEDYKEFARVNGLPSIVLEISKRNGKNIIDTVNQVKYLMDKAKDQLPENLKVVYLNDQSKDVRNVLDDLQNGIIFAVLLILIIIILSMGMRIAILVALSIPGSFLMGIIALYFMGITLNIVVLFSLIMAVGMLVDDAIVISEYADRKMICGMDKAEAFHTSVRDMFYPVLSSTLTKLAVFFPLLFWPDTVGKFMQYIPITMILTLTGSLIMALVFIPTLGAIFGEPSVTSKEEIEKMNAIESGEIKSTGPMVRAYVRILEKVLDHPKKFVCAVVFVLFSFSVLYFAFGPGVKFFPKVDSDNILISVKAKGNLSAKERDLILKEVENRILNMEKEVKIFYAKSGLFGDDVIARIQLELVDWHFRRKARDILNDIRACVQDMKGVVIDIQEENPGPSADKPIQINLSGSALNLDLAVEKILKIMNQPSSGFINIQDSRFTPEIEWNMSVDKNKAASSGVNVATIGDFIKMVTSGVLVGKYRSNNLNEEIDIILRFPEKDRNMKTIENLFINTTNGPCPMSNIVKYAPEKKINKLNRINGSLTMTISADVDPSYLVDERVKFIQDSIAKNWDKGVKIDFKGDKEDQKKSEAFLLKAFLLAITLMILVLVTQFNSVYHTFIVMTAVFLSTTCVFFVFFLINKVFVIVMCGVGVIALAGIIVNNNILLLDAFHHQVKIYKNNIKRCVINASISRIRPILLTVATTVLGLIPMITKLNIDFFSLQITYDAPSSQWWVDISTTVACGILAATVLTLFFTPALLVMQKHEKT
ncbi:efflux RND transporter permease subunit [Wolbachia endosymbiont of Atemnus politus]|uniref:efflux RND transporter permease subunit n=1 Tax=Wolbachia endosymbiont of Atemnus politus TaxID=2682840 RepID=UPI001573341E|nr:efflux RND transporter permease subunit [Wolbachia endosymbiont of Atemnus politus]NSM56524.1 efflux RND transporter permease subunit [Wolbachia endosymbiont of Atemnus politus]NSX83212.1 AcrB/AcrD/AcrF family protein [Wolbachia endosymbiont of Atemnus politus]